MGWGALDCSNLTASEARGGVARNVTVWRDYTHIVIKLRYLISEYLKHTTYEIGCNP